MLREGNTLETYGTGNPSTGLDELDPAGSGQAFAFGYPSIALRAGFGGLMDAATGLLYVGNGQYYDPLTGRFLTRGVNPDNPNPYIPWNPIGAVIGPLGLIALVFGRRKKGSKVGTLLVLLLVGASVGMTVAGCGGEQQPQQGSQVTVIATPISSQQILAVPIVNGTPGAPFVISVPPTTTPEEIIETTCAEAITPTPTPTPTCPSCPNQYAQMLYDAVLAVTAKPEYKLPPGFSVALLFAMAAVETGGNNPAYQNSVTHGGAFQLRKESGHYAPNGYYEDTPAGYEQNVKDALATIKDNHVYAQTARNPLTYYHFLYEETYPQHPDEITAAVTVLFYNGGTHWWDKDNPESYWYYPTSRNKPYVGNVARMLESYVPQTFGFSDPVLVDILTSLQAVVYAYVPDTP